MGRCKVVACTCVMVMAMMMVNVQGSVSDDVEAILAQGRKLVQAFNARDIDTYLSSFTEDCRVYLPGGPEIRGREGQL